MARKKFQTPLAFHSGGRERAAFYLTRSVGAWGGKWAGVLVCLLHVGVGGQTRAWSFVGHDRGAVWDVTARVWDMRVGPCEGRASL